MIQYLPDISNSKKPRWRRPSLVYQCSHPEYLELVEILNLRAWLSINGQTAKTRAGTIVMRFLGGLGMSQVGHLHILRDEIDNLIPQLSSGTRIRFFMFISSLKAIPQTTGSAPADLLYGKDYEEKNA